MYDTCELPRVCLWAAVQKSEQSLQTAAASNKPIFTERYIRKIIHLLKQARCARHMVLCIYRSFQVYKIISYPSHACFPQKGYLAFGYHTRQDLTLLTTPEGTFHVGCNFHLGNVVTNRIPCYFPMAGAPKQCWSTSNKQDSQFTGNQPRYRVHLRNSCWTLFLRE